ncbi:MAG: YcbK family protein [Roseinatronobacter sp.]
MTETGSSGITRRSILQVFAATLVTAAPFFSSAPAYARGAGDIRKVNFYSGRTGEKMNLIYWIDGNYVPESMAEINHFFRDWRNNKVKTVDPRTVDFLAATHNLLRASEPYMLLSGYRSPETNAMLRARSRGVASDSLHMRGQAADVRLQSRTVGQIARAATACSGGGVGKYSRSNFVHFDCGASRTWGA